MSRLIIKSLPPDATADTLRAHFAERGGTVTDAKLARKRDGTSRRFGFVGFKTEEEARDAREWFNGTYWGTWKLNVDVVSDEKPIQRAPPPKRRRLSPPPPSASVPSASKQPSSAAPTASSSAPPAKKSKSSAQLDEFLSVMGSKPKGKGRSWEDSVPAASEPAPVPEPEAEAEEPEPVVEEVKPKKKKKRAREPTPEVQAQEEKVDGESAECEDAAMRDVDAEGLTDLEYMRLRMKRRHIPEEEGNREAKKVESESEEEEDEIKETPAEAAARRLAEASEQILSTGRLFVRNLAFSCTESELAALFSKYGVVSQTHIPLSPTTKTPHGIGYVTFAQPNAALAAFQALDGSTFQGRIMHVLPAVNRKQKEEPGKMSVKKVRAKDRREGAEGREWSWSGLFMNQDAVLSSVADRLKLSKADILDPSSDNAAVRLALAETHVIAETKSFLSSSGVNLEAFDPAHANKQPRSETTILVKNIPYGTSADTVRDTFAPHGELARVLVPPAGTIAIVEFILPQEARKAFRALAYKRMGNSVLYLEKGPGGMWEGGAAPTDAKAVVTAPSAVVTLPDQSAAVESTSSSAAPGATLFVKNLSFATVESKFSSTFASLPGFVFARIQTKPDPKKPGARLSMGYGFVGFKDAADAKSAAASMQGFVLDGHALQVKFAHRGREEDEGKDGKEAMGKTKTTKMIVKNLPFEASKKDVRELFGAHGQLKSVRLPRKFDAKTRGFAFLEFATRREAENAFEALKHSHLLGRHLVLQWAEDEGADVEGLREKTRVGFRADGKVPGRTEKFQGLGVGQEGAGMEED